MLIASVCLSERSFEFILFWPSKPRTRNKWISHICFKDLFLGTARCYHFLISLLASLYLQGVSFLISKTQTMCCSIITCFLSFQVISCLVLKTHFHTSVAHGNVRSSRDHQGRVRTRSQNNHCRSSPELSALCQVDKREKSCRGKRRQRSHSSAGRRSIGRSQRPPGYVSQCCNKTVGREENARVSWKPYSMVQKGQNTATLQ